MSAPQKETGSVREPGRGERSGQGADHTEKEGVYRRDKAGSGVAVDREAQGRLVEAGRERGDILGEDHSVREG